jgi:uncharacterized protein (DUF58 family)
LLDGVLPIPSRALLLLGAAWLLLGLYAAFVPERLIWWQAAGTALAVFALADALAARSLRDQVEAGREVSEALPVGTWQTVHLRLRVRGGRAAGFITDTHPASFAAQELPLAFKLAAGQWLRLGYRAQLTERGPQTFGESVLLPFGDDREQVLLGREVPVEGPPG